MFNLKPLKGDNVNAGRISSSDWLVSFMLERHLLSVTLKTHRKYLLYVLKIPFGDSLRNFFVAVWVYVEVLGNLNVNFVH